MLTNFIGNAYKISHIHVFSLMVMGAFRLGTCGQICLAPCVRLKHRQKHQSALHKMNIKPIIKSLISVISIKVYKITFNEKELL